jgi:hypothetical protein
MPAYIYICGILDLGRIETHNYYSLPKELCYARKNYISGIRESYPGAKDYVCVSIEFAPDTTPRHVAC